MKEGMFLPKPKGRKAAAATVQQQHHDEETRHKPTPTGSRAKLPLSVDISDSLPSVETGGYDTAAVGHSKDRQCTTSLTITTSSFMLDDGIDYGYQVLSDQGSGGDLKLCQNHVIVLLSDEHPDPLLWGDLSRPDSLASQLTNNGTACWFVPRHYCHRAGFTVNDFFKCFLDRVILPTSSDGVLRKVSLICSYDDDFQLGDDEPLWRSLSHRSSAMGSTLQIQRFLLINVSDVRRIVNQLCMVLSYS
jgi:hypothetical protein